MPALAIEDARTTGGGGVRLEGLSAPASFV